MVSCEQERKETCRINLKGTERAVVTALSLIVTKNEGRGCPCQLYDNISELHKFEYLYLITRQYVIKLTYCGKIWCRNCCIVIHENFIVYNRYTCLMHTIQQNPILHMSRIFMIILSFLYKKKYSNSCSSKRWHLKLDTLCLCTIVVGWHKQDGGYKSVSEAFQQGWCL